MPNMQTRMLVAPVERARTFILRAFCSTQALLAAGCSSPTVTCDADVAQVTQSIKYAPGTEGENPASIAAVLYALDVVEESQVRANTCTLTRVARGRALTAKHCVRDRAADSLALRAAGSVGGDLTQSLDECARSAESTAPSNSTAPSANVTEILTHPEYDLALLSYEEATLLPTATLNEGPIDLHQSVRIAGVGLTELGTKGELRVIDTAIKRVTPELIVVGDSQGGACLGDSGGPLYVDRREGIELLGVLSQGSASCLGDDEYVSVAAAADWLNSLL